MKARVVLLAILLSGATAIGASPAILEVPARRVEGDARRITVPLAPGTSVGPGTRLLLAGGGQPFGWADLKEADADHAVFEIPPQAELPSRASPLRGWLVAPHLVATLLDDWPADAALYADVDSLGPAGRSAWIHAGSDHGARVGDSWWLRVGGQPSARCDVLFVAPGLCYCTVEPLASTPTLREGSRVALWPAPGERRMGRATSAVAFVEERGGSDLVWVAALPHIDCPTEPHLDFFRDGHYLGHGLVERRDARFWYARFTPLAGIDESAAPGASSDTAPACPVASTDAPATSTTTRPASTVQVGDTVRVRTRSDIDQGRLVARVFDLTPAGAAINAGEIDGVTVGQRFTVYRDGRPFGPAVVRRVQRSYAIVTPPDMLIDPPLVLRIGDELRLRPPPPPPRAVATISAVVGESVFVARLLGTEGPIVRPLAVCDDDRTVGVAVLVNVEAGSAIGFSLPCAATAPLAAGQRLVLDTPASSNPPSAVGEPTDGDGSGRLPDPH